MKKILIISIILSFVLGYFVGIYTTNHDKIVLEEKIKEEFPDYKEDIELYSTTAEILKVGSDYLILEVIIPKSNPIEGNIRMERKALINNTKIIKFERVESVENPYKEVEVNIEELEKGQKISFVSIEDISQNKTITLKKIMLND